MPAVALVLSDPVSDLALGEAGVGLLLASVGVGHLRRVHHPFRQASTLTLTRVCQQSEKCAKR